MALHVWPRHPSGRQWVLNAAAGCRPISLQVPLDQAEEEAQEPCGGGCGLLHKVSMQA